jgi:hypothetical protein
VYHVTGHDRNPISSEKTFMWEAESDSRCSEKEPSGLREEVTHSDDGVDLTLIRWMLSLTPSERLQVLQQNVRSLARLCNESSFT